MAEQSNNNKKDNRGFLNKNGFKNKATQPDWTGTIIVDGKEKKISGWINKTADGREYISLVASDPLTPEQQSQYRQNSDGPAENPVPRQNTQSPNQNQQNNGAQNPHEYLPSQQDYDLSDDISDILKSGEDDNPFN